MADLKEEEYRALLEEKGINPASKVEGPRAALPGDWMEEWAAKKFPGGAAGLAGAESLANTALFGIPEVILKSANSDAYRDYAALKEKHPTASTVGTIAGSLAPTEGGLVTGLAKGAKLVRAGKASESLAKAAKIIREGGQVGKLGKVASGAVRGGLMSAEQMLPRVVTGQANVQDMGTELALGAGLGGGASAIGELGSRLPEIAKSLSKWGNKTILKNADINNRILRASERYAGKDPGQYVKELADFAEKNQLHREPKLDALVAKVKQTWQDIGKTFDASGYSAADDLARIMKNADVKEVIARNPAAVTTVADLAGKIDASSNLYEKRRFLNDLIYNSTDAEEKRMARGILDALEEKAEELSGLDMGKAKQEWKMMKPFEQADIRDELSTTGAGLVRGSDTAAKLAMGGLGAVAGGGSQIGGVADDPTNPEAWKKLLLATAGGTITGAMSKQLSLAAARLARKLDPDDIAAMINKGQFNKVIAMAEKIPVEDIVKPGTKLLAQEMQKKYTGKQPEREVNGIPILAEGQKEQIGQDGALSAPEQPVNAQFMDKINEKLYEDYLKYYANQMDFDTFYEQARAVTNNFDPRKSAKILYKDPKQRAKFLKDYAVAQKIGATNLGETFKKGGMLDLLDSGKAAERELGRKELVNTIAGLVTEQGKLPAKETLNRIDSDIRTILALKVTEEQKKKILLQQLAGYGLDYETLSGMGLA